MAIAPGGNPTVLRLQRALGLADKQLRSFSLHLSVNDAITMEGEVNLSPGVKVEFEELVDQQQLDNITAAIELELRNGFLVSADWLEENGFDEAAAAMRLSVQ